MVDTIATSGAIHLEISDHSLIYAARKFAVPKTRLIIKEVEISNILSKWILLMTLMGSRGKMFNALMTLT